MKVCTEKNCVQYNENRIDNCKYYRNIEDCNYAKDGFIIEVEIEPDYFEKRLKAIEEKCKTLNIIGMESFNYHDADKELREIEYCLNEVEKIINKDI